MALRLAFMGTPDFAVPALDAILAAGHEVVAVYSQPPRAAGRGQISRDSPVAELAKAHALSLLTPAHFKLPETVAEFAALNLDAAVVVAYGLLLPSAVLSAPRWGCYNIHASLLPRWRGAAPIQRAIAAGDTESGISIMKMDEGLDTGDIALTHRVKINRDDTAGILHDRLAKLGAQMIISALKLLAAGRLQTTPQAQNGVTYAKKIDKAEARLDFNQSAASLECLIRAFNPWPGAYIDLAGERIKIHHADIVDISGPPGKILDAQFTIACGEASLRPRILQRSGKTPMSCAEFLRGFDLPVGQSLL